MQKSEKSYLWFTGNTEGAVVYIDDVLTIELPSSYYIDSEGNRRKRTKAVHYEVSPGKRTIRIERDGEVIVHRELMLGNQMTREISVP